MKKTVLIFYLLFLPFLVKGSIIDILEKRDSSFNFKKQIKQDISVIFVNKPLAFIQAFEAKDFEKALEIWQKNIQPTSFSKSSTGSALYAYLLFKNHFELLALNYLLKNSKTSQIHPVVIRLWKLDIDKTKAIWDNFYFPISPDWQNVFSPEIVFKIASKSSFHLVKDQDYMKLLLALPLEDKVDVFSLEWIFVLSLIKKQDMDSATKVLAWLLSKTKDSYRKDKINLTIARLLANIEEVEASEHYYKKLNKLSYLWFLAQEEMAWLNLRLGDNSKAYSKAMALKHPDFLESISPSMYFITAFSQLKNCDDEGAVQTLMSFKKTFFNQYTGLQKILDQKLYTNLIGRLLDFYGSNAYQIKSPLIDLFSQDTIASKSKTGNDKYSNKTRSFKINLFYNLRTDSQLKNKILLYNYIENQKKKRNKKFKKLVTIENNIIKNLKNKIEKKIDLIIKKELENIKLALKSFHLMEAEILYRKYVSSPALTLAQGQSWSKDISLYRNNLLYFPYNRDEIWLDELSSYKADKSSQCPDGRYIL